VGVGCGDDDSSLTSSSVSQDKYSETIVGTWEYDSDPMWTFLSDGTVLLGDLRTGESYLWTIEGSRLSITDSDGNLTSEYPYESKSMSSTKLVFISKINKVDGSGTVEAEL
jgi:hypothetical protein